jgi:TorA maturation chaperone TorD
MGGDAGLGEAIRAAGGVTELARRIEISQPSVSNWSRVPADRVVAVEAATGVARAVLRPDLFAGTTDAVDDTGGVARAQEYALLAALLARPPDAAVLKRLAKLESDGTPLGLAHRALAGAAVENDAAAVAREYFELFIGVGRGELLPYGSYYLTGFLHERPLARLRADLASLGIERVEGQWEPEDHAAILCEIMAGLIAGDFAVPVERQRHFFDRHLAQWMGRFFADLEAAKGADFYRPVGAIGRLFIEIETQAFALPA